MIAIKPLHVKSALISSFIFAVFTLILVASAPQPAPAQGALVTSGAQQGAAGTARLSAMAQQLGIRLAKLEVCNEKGLVYDPDDALADADDCAVGANPCGNSGMLYGPSHPNADADGCVPDVKVESDGTVTFSELSTHSEGAQLGSPTTCTSTTEGTLRYKTATSKLQLCDGSAWTDLN